MRADGFLWRGVRSGPRCVASPVMGERRGNGQAAPLPSKPKVSDPRSRLTLTGRPGRGNDHLNLSEPTMNPDADDDRRFLAAYAAEVFDPDVVAFQRRRGRVMSRAAAAAFAGIGFFAGGVLALVGDSGAWVPPALGIALAAATLLVMPLAWDQVMGLRVDRAKFVEWEGRNR